jgi:TusA-related sulfurtransferase
MAPDKVIRIDAELDLRGVRCPYNYVRTKLKLETMQPGEVLSITVDDGEPIENVPRSVQQDGHSVLSQQKIETGYRVVIRRT